MASAIDFPQSNKTLIAPAEREETVQPLHIYSNGHQCVSCWELNEEERAEVARTGRIFVNLLSGPTQPPVYVWVGPLASGLF